MLNLETVIISRPVLEKTSVFNFKSDAIDYFIEFVFRNFKMWENVLLIL